MATLKRDLTLEQQLSKGPVDLPFLMLVILLTAIGIIAVFSASYATAVHEGRRATYYFVRQAGFAAIGLFLMYIAARINYQNYRWASVLVLGAALFLLVLVLVPGFHTVRSDHVRRWLKGVAFLPAFQPSELAKLGVILFFAARMAKRETEPPLKLPREDTRWSRFVRFLERIGFVELIPYGAVLGIIMLLMYFEPHMSGTILILIPAAAILFAGGIGLGWFAAGAGAVAAVLYAMISRSKYQSGRIAIWKDPWSDPGKDGYQIIQSLYAIGSGGLFGVGFGQGRQKQLFLPEAENDFIFSVWCEEMGLVGACVVVLLFMLLIIRGYWIALHARDRFGSLLVVGITTLMAAQVFLNISVVTNFLPTTGVSLPFFSYGGTALVIQLIEMGIVLGVSRQIKVRRQE